MTDTTYDYLRFWRELQHPGSVPPATGQSPDHLRQEAALLRAIRTHHLNAKLIGPEPKDRDPVNDPDPATIFEVGCGYGRLTALFAHFYPEARYSAIDLNADCVKAALDIRPDASIEVADILTYDTQAAYDDPDFAGYDLVIASEVLMHIPPDYLEDAFNKLVDLTHFNGRLITIDWVPEPGELNRLRRTKSGIAPWNFAHDYLRLFKTRTSVLGAHRTDRQVIYVLKP